MDVSFCVGFLPFSQIDWDLKKETPLPGEKVTEKESVEGGVRRGWEVSVPEGGHNQRLKAEGHIPGWVPGVVSAALFNLPSIPAEKGMGREQGGRSSVQRGCGCSSPGRVQGQLGHSPE